MDLLNLTVARVILHEVFRRADDRQRVQPTYGAALEQLDESALDALRDRIVSAMSRSDRCVQMELIPNAPMLPLVEALVDADDTLFLSESREVPNALAEAQTSRQYPGGVVVVFSGTVGAPAKRMLGIIKAEVHSGFLRETVQGRLRLKFLDKLLLTPQTKLYKIGMYVENDPAATLPEQKWHAFIYDDGMSARDRYGAAQYFYESFLGLAFPQSSAMQTKAFHDLTKSFVRDLGVPEEAKLQLNNALVTYLKADQSPTVSVPTFSQAYFDTPDLRDAYEQFMAESGFPNTAVHKDLADVERSLRLRKLVFTRDVKITAPADAFEDMIQIRTVDASGPMPEGAVPKWTVVTIKDRIRAQE